MKVERVLQGLFTNDGALRAEAGAPRFTPCRELQLHKQVPLSDAKGGNSPVPASRAGDCPRARLFRLLLLGRLPTEHLLYGRYFYLIRKTFTYFEPGSKPIYNKY